jgi:hypothetical protein
MEGKEATAIGAKDAWAREPQKDSGKRKTASLLRDIVSLPGITDEQAIEMWFRRMPDTGAMAARLAEIMRAKAAQEETASRVASSDGCMAIMILLPDIEKKAEADIASAGRLEPMTYAALASLARLMKDSGYENSGTFKWMREIGYGGIEKHQDLLPWLKEKGIVPDGERPEKATEPEPEPKPDKEASE